MNFNVDTDSAESVGWRFDNTYSRLPDVFFLPAQPAEFPAPQLIIVNEPLARELGLDTNRVSTEILARLFSGQIRPSGSLTIAQAYAGHQFGHFTMLGDGRAILLGEHRTPAGKLVDIQFKGPGQTPLSRRGDGRAALGPMLREYLISEAMFALGIPTTRSLAVVTTGEPVFRQTRLQGAVLTRVAASHIRVGTFQYAAARQETANLQILADYALRRHYPEIEESAAPYLNFLRAVMIRQASLIAQWQQVGFIHGVMNTDNMAISGETIDYGPCAFMNAYHPATVFSSIDHSGRYAYSNQPAIGQWNLTRFAEALLPLLAENQDEAISIAKEVLEEYPKRFEEQWLNGFQSKLGLSNSEPGDLELIQSLLKWMDQASADFTNTFRDLSRDEPLTSDAYAQPAFQSWQEKWQERLDRQGIPRESVSESMKRVNPAVIPRNHRVEEALSAAEDHNDLTLFNRLLGVVQQPFDESAEAGPYREPPQDDSDYRTFCGT